ncbi:transposase family protein [Streptomyces sp. NPDC059278]|uniref:transposase family protein n=1 Tax=Streptomyces sp. NPDC059278 TaxID=3346801 RepID=UPI00369C7357
MTAAQLEQLTRTPIPALEDWRESLRHQQRGGNRLRGRGAGAKDTLTAPDRILATVLHQGKIGAHDLLAALFGVTRSTMSRAVQEVQPLLAEHGHTIPPSTARFRTPADVAAFLTPEAVQREIKSAC